MSIRCFVAVPLPGEYQDGLGELVRELRTGVRSGISWTRPGNWHLTLKFLGEVEEGRVLAVREALGAVRFAPFALQAGRGGFFPDIRRPRVLWVGLEQGGEECAVLAAGVDEALSGIGFSSEERGFRAHLTLGRIRREARDDWKGMAEALQGRHWPKITVSEFVLYRSVLGPLGPEYSRLQEFAATERQ